MHNYKEKNLRKDKDNKFENELFDWLLVKYLNMLINHEKFVNDTQFQW